MNTRATIRPKPRDSASLRNFPRDATPTPAPASSREQPVGHSHLLSILSPMRDGDLSALFAALDPACVLRMGASDQPGEGGAGVYVSTVVSPPGKVDYR